MTGQDLKSVRIAGKAFTCDAREARHSGIGYLPKVLTLLNGGDVNLNRGDGDCFEGVEDRYARVRVCSGIDDDAVDASVCLLDTVNDCPLMVGLEYFDSVKTKLIGRVLAYLHERFVVVRP